MRKFFVVLMVVLALVALAVPAFAEHGSIGGVGVMETGNIGGIGHK